MDFAKKPSKLAFCVVLCATDSFFYPVVNDYVLLLTELVNFKALVLHRLLVTAYPNVSVNHFFHNVTKERDIRGIRLLFYWYIAVR